MEKSSPIITGTIAVLPLITLNPFAIRFFLIYSALSTSLVTRSGSASKISSAASAEGLDKVKFVYNKAWAPNWGFIPLSNAQIDLMAKDLKPIVEPSLVLFGEIDGQLVGFALVMLDYNKIFKEMNGRLLPFNFIKLFTKKKSIKWARIITLGIVPEHHKKGLDAVFYWEIVNRAHAVGIDLGEASWILEDNEMMNRGAVMMGGDHYKSYRIWEINI